MGSTRKRPTALPPKEMDMTVPAWTTRVVPTIHEEAAGWRFGVVGRDRVAESGERRADPWHIMMSLCVDPRVMVQVQAMRRGEG